MVACGRLELAVHKHPIHAWAISQIALRSPFAKVNSMSLGFMHPFELADYSFAVT